MEVEGNPWTCTVSPTNMEAVLHVLASLVWPSCSYQFDILQLDMGKSFGSGLLYILHAALNPTSRPTTANDQRN